MGDFVFAVGLIGWFLGIGIFIYSFFSKKKISRKKVIVGIISAFAAMVCGVAISHQTQNKLQHIALSNQQRLVLPLKIPLLK